MLDRRRASSRAGLYASTAFPLSKNGFVNLAVQAGGIPRRAIVHQRFNLGGFLRLSGLRTDQLSGDYLGLPAPSIYHQIGNMPLLGRGIHSAARSREGKPWVVQRHFRQRALAAGSVFIAADTWIGPFYFAWGHASGGQSSFYIFLGRL